jgi:TolB protein
MQWSNLAARLSLVAMVMVAVSGPGGMAETLPTTGGDSLRVVIYEVGVENAYPRWSRDGQRILFQSNRTGKWQLYTVKRDGSDLKRITNDEHNNYMADWSPDNRQIAFVSDRDGNEDIFVMGSDGSGITNLSRHPARDIHPYWLRDGKRLYFNSTRGNGGALTIYEMSARGENLRRISTSNDDETCARQSPDAGKVVYLRAFAGSNDEIFVLDLNSGKATNVTRSNEAEGWPTWSADGKRVICSSTRAGQFRLFAVNSDGSGLTQLTQPPDTWYDACAQVSPDGREIVFNRQKSGSIGILIDRLPQD